MEMPKLKYVNADSGLHPFKSVILKRIQKSLVKEFDFTKGVCLLKDSFNNHLYYGLHKTSTGWVFREWAPNARKIYLVGDFNQWQQVPAYALTPIGNGNWEGVFDEHAFRHEDLFKLYMEWDGGSGERLPAYVQRVVQDEKTKMFAAQVWQPKPYHWKWNKRLKIDNPLIYEAHVGMSAERPGISNFVEFRENVLPRIKELGYNVIQLMAVQEHPYYGSFGYQVANFYAPSSRFGTPEQLKELIDAAHQMGIAVIMDIVHSHAVKNVGDGLNQFDGSSDLYFHQGQRGEHSLWDSKCFDYGKDEVLAFLLSNLKYWQEEYRFDGFRFDGITSMIYFDHGLGKDFVNYSMYFDGGQDEDALVFLALANRLIHQVNADAITIAEDVSGMPGLAVPLEDGGWGFDYRMSMGVADYWIRMIKEKADQDWSVGEMYYQLTNKRNDEHTVSYAECHDQAMVGDKTIIFRLIDKEMYTAMRVDSNNLIVDRGVALHKMIRLITLSTAGDGYLNFMGNEFGHPEWIDFPREGNNWNYYYARRQWSLTEDHLLRYRMLQYFDKMMLHLVVNANFFKDKPLLLHQNETDHVLAFQRGEYVFVFNFHPDTSFENYEIRGLSGKYQVALDSDALCFNGFGRVDDKMKYIAANDMLRIYLPTRTALVFQKIVS